MAKVVIARAVYANRDLILMDDPIKYFDKHTQKKIFKNVLMKKFAKKTRIMVTHALDYLHFADTIILMKEGRIALQGPLKEIKGHECF